MKKIKLIFCLAIVLFASCDKKKKGHMMFCTELYTSKAPQPENGFLAAAAKQMIWPNQIDMPLTILVKFLNGSFFQKNKVKQYAQVWNNASALGWNNKHKIQFLFVADNYAGPTNVRIWFESGPSQSVIGSDCANVPQDQATTLFGWVDEDHSEEEIRSVILHELGHTLGMVHEHQSPAANVPWDTAKVYKFYHDTQTPPWSKGKVDTNVFMHYSEDETNHTAFDRSSIMLYEIPDSLTINRSYSTPFNTMLSATDISFIKGLYRYEKCTSGKNCCFDTRNRGVPCR